MNRELKFRVYSKRYGMSEPCSIFDLQIMDEEGLTDMSQVEIMQYTGLNDKNGENGFESDIIKEGNSIGVITFVDGSFIIDWVINKDFWSYTLKFHLSSAKIIGNKFEHPELLNADENGGK